MAAKKKSLKKKAAKKKTGKKKVAKKVTSKKKVSKISKPEKKADPKAKKGAEEKVRVLPQPTPASGVTLKTGQIAPLFALFSDSGEEITLDSLRGKKVVLYFYPKDDTPGCTKQACDFRDQFGRIQGKDVVVLGVSKDSVALHQRFKQKYNLPFTLLADTQGKTVQDYGVWKEKQNYGRTYMGIERTTFLIDAQGKIRKIYPKVKVEGHVAQVLSDLAKI